MPSRVKAFLVHLAGSMTVLAVLLYLIVFKWYPQPMFAADGGWEGIRLIAGIDVVLGPILTLLIYNPAKGMKKLKFDMATILAVQVLALSIGAYIVHDQRTRLVVFADDHFESLTGEQVEEAKVDPALWKKLNEEQHPAMAYVSLPDNPSERSKFIMKTIFSGIPLSKRADHYQTLTPENRKKMMEKGYDLLTHINELPEYKRILDKFLTKHGGKESDYAYLKLDARYDDTTIVMRKRDGKIVGSLPIDFGEYLSAAAKLKQASENKQTAKLIKTNKGG